MFQLSDFWYVERQGKLRKFVATAMSEQFHQQLNQLALNAQQYQPGSRQRTRAVGDIYKVIANSPELKKHKYGLFKRYRNQDSNVTKNLFEDCYANALSDTRTEVLLQKIDRYNPGNGYILSLDWQQFKQDLQSNPENSSALAEDFIKKIDCYRQSVDESLIENDRQNQSEELESICSEFADSIKEAADTNSYSSEKLDALWNGFTKQMKPGDRSKNLFHWFIFVLRYRFINRKNEALGYTFTRRRVEDSVTGELVDGTILHSTESLDAPVSADGQATLGDSLAAQANPDRTLENLIEEDPDGIFQAKYLRNYPNINFRAIQLLHFKKCSCKEIVAYFDNRVSLGSISSQYNRSLKYFRPILEEYLTAIFPLTESAITIIRQDLEISTGAKSSKKPSEIKMSERGDISFQKIIVQRKDQFPSWQLLAESLNLSSKDVILFYLDYLQKSQLYQTREERQQQQ